ncbi:MAG: hypothetical protein IJG86_02630, partial [Clostridia bacterium]|nr:hypothetical protein [Clostridia bacterium]
SRNLQAADVGKGTARCAAVLCGISLKQLIIERVYVILFVSVRKCQIVGIRFISQQEGRKNG